MANVHHISVTAAEVASAQAGGRLFFLPGSFGRARLIAERFEDRRVLPSDRGHDVYTGTLRFGEQRVDVGAVATGMGCPSTGIIVTELLLLGARRFLRVGTAGSLQPEVKIAHVVVATGAVRDEAASLSYAPAEVPAVASPDMTASLLAAARKLNLADCTHAGLIHSKDSFYGREFGDGPLATENNRCIQLLRDLNVLASEMEASHLFILAQAAARETKYGYAPPSEPISVQAGCVLGILGNIETVGSEAERALAVDRAMQIALESANPARS